jgi:hypothetical protein
MTVIRYVSCDSPDCKAVWDELSLRPSRLTVTERGNHSTRHFCSWKCALRYGAQFFPPEEQAA